MIVNVSDTGEITIRSEANRCRYIDMDPFYTPGHEYALGPVEAVGLANALLDAVEILDPVVVYGAYSKRIRPPF